VAKQNLAGMITVEKRERLAPAPEPVRIFLLTIIPSSTLVNMWAFHLAYRKPSQKQPLNSAAHPRRLRRYHPLQPESTPRLLVNPLLYPQHHHAQKTLPHFQQHQHQPAPSPPPPPPLPLARDPPPSRKQASHHTTIRPLVNQKRSMGAERPTRRTAATTRSRNL